MSNVEFAEGRCVAGGNVSCISAAGLDLEFEDCSPDALKAMRDASLGYMELHGFLLRSVLVDETASMHKFDRRHLGAGLHFTAIKKSRHGADLWVGKVQTRAEVLKESIEYFRNEADKKNISQEVRETYLRNAEACERDLAEFTPVDEPDEDLDYLDDRRAECGSVSRIYGVIDLEFERASPKALEAMREANVSHEQFYETLKGALEEKGYLEGFAIQGERLGGNLYFFASRKSLTDSKRWRGRIMTKAEKLEERIKFYRFESYDPQNDADDRALCKRTLKALEEELAQLNSADSTS